MPVMANKRPIHKLWEKTKKEYDFTNADAYGLVCGSISDNLEVIDIDSKYDITNGKTLFKDYKRAINNIDPNLLEKLVVQKTVNGGYHFIYKCDYIEGSRKLAERETTHTEKHETYLKSYEYALSQISLLDTERESTAKSIAEKASKNDKVRVLLETRGEKGYIACTPTVGYSFLHGDFNSIQRITETERNVLINVAYSFNEVLKEPIKHVKTEIKNYKGLTPSEDYNERGDILGLLRNHGWIDVGKKGSKILFRRPGDTKADHSGNFDEEKNWFSVFTTSTEFQSQTPYLPYAVFCVLECNSDYTKVPIKLKELGFGNSIEEKKENDVKIPSSIDMTNDDIDFIATEEDYNEYLDTWRNGTFEKGKETGFEDLDKYFLFKEGDLVIVNGIDNVGKSTVIWYLGMLSAIKHDWNWLIFSSENKVGGVVRKLIEFYWSEPLPLMSKEKFEAGKLFVKNHFSIIKCKDTLYNYSEIMDMTKKASKKKKYNALMVDPYNSLKIDIPIKSKQGTYEYHYEAASNMQLFGKKNNISIFLNCHVGTVGARNKDTKGHTKPPQKEDTEMGVMFANKADQFLTIHRYVQKEEEFLFTEIHVRKVKEVETGGGVTPLDKPFKMMMINGFCGFSCKEKHQNPIRDFHSKLNIKQLTKEEVEMEFKSAVAIVHQEEEEEKKPKYKITSQQSEEETPF